MKVGRELDVLVAEKVMGFAMLIEPHCDECASMNEPMYRDENGVGPVPPYSTDIADAWQVVEVFRQGRFRRPDGNPGVACCVDLHVTDAPEINGDCFCSIYGPMTAKVEAQAQEMSLAICLAALKAVGWTEESK